MAAKLRVIVLAGYGLNCETETAFGFELAGARAEIIHLNDLIAGPQKLDACQILAIPGGFAYGDHTGSGRAFANKLVSNLGDRLRRFVSQDKLLLAICNGFQIVTRAGLLPGVLLPNAAARYVDRWVDLQVQNRSPWLSGLDRFAAPIAHGEGNYYVAPLALKQLQAGQQIALRYVSGETCRSTGQPANPNGSLYDIAGVTDKSGRVLGLMPHPERALFFTQLPDWPLKKERLLRDHQPLPRFGPGIRIFQNGVNYFRG